MWQIKTVLLVGKYVPKGYAEELQDDAANRWLSDNPGWEPVSGPVPADPGQTIGYVNGNAVISPQCITRWFTVRRKTEGART